MAATEPIHHLMNVNHLSLSKSEIYFLEAELILNVCDELRQNFNHCYKDYFQVMKIVVEKESEVLDIHFMRWVINEILATDSYTLQGIAYYTGMPEDLLIDVVLGKNTNPLVMFLIKIIELHREVNKVEYTKTIRRIIEKLANE